MVYIDNTLDEQHIYIPRNDNEGSYESSYDKGYEDGFSDGLQECGTCNLQDKEVVLTATTETVTADTGYAGMERVFVDGRQLSMEKYTEGYRDGYENQRALLSSTAFTHNDTYTNEDGWSGVTVAVPVLGNFQEKSYGIESGFTGATIYPDRGYEGINKMVITDEGYGQSKYDEGYDSGYNSGRTDGCNECYESGYNSGHTDGIADQKALLSSTTITENGVYTREDGWSSVTVETTSELQSKSVYQTASTQTYVPDSGYDGMSEITVDASPYGQSQYQDGYGDGYANGYASGYTNGDAAGCERCYESGYTAGYNSGRTDGCEECFDSGYESGATDQRALLTATTFTQNDTYTNSNGWSAVTVNVPTGTPCTLESKTYQLESGFTGTTITPSSGYDGMSDVTITDNGYGQSQYDSGYGDGYSSGFTDGSSGSCSLQNVEVALTAATQTILPESGYDGMSMVDVDASDLIQGEYNEGYQDGFDDGRDLLLQHKIASQTAVTQTHYPDAGDGCLSIIGDANIVTNFYPNNAYTANSNYLCVEIEAVFNGEPSSSQSLFTTNDIFGFTCRRLQSSQTVLSIHSELAGRVDSSYSNIKFVLDNGTGTTYANGEFVRTNTYSQTTLGSSYLIFAPNFGAGALNVSLYSVRFKDRNGNLLANFVPDIHNGGAIKDTVANAVYDVSGNGTAVFSTVYDGMSAITVNASAVYNSGVTDGIASARSAMTSTAFTANDTYTNASGWSSVTVNVPQTTVACNLQSKSVVLNQSATIFPDSGYDGMSAITVNVENVDVSGYKSGVTSVIKSFFTGNTIGVGNGYYEYGVVTAYYYTPTTQRCLITGYEEDCNEGGERAFSSMSVDGGSWQTPSRFYTLSAGWHQIRFIVADKDLHYAFCHHFPACGDCFMDALVAVSIPEPFSGLTGVVGLIGTFRDNTGLRILSTSLPKYGYSGMGGGLSGCTNLNVIFSHYTGSETVRIDGNNIPNTGVLFYPQGKSSIHANTLSGWTKIELF